MCIETSRGMSGIYLNSKPNQKGRLRAAFFHGLVPGVGGVGVGGIPTTARIVGRKLLGGGFDNAIWQRPSINFYRGAVGDVVVNPFNVADGETNTASRSRRSELIIFLPFQLTGVGLIIWHRVNPIRTDDADGIFTPDVADEPAPKWADARHFEGTNRGVASAPSGSDKGFDETSVFTFRIKTINHHHLVGFGNFDVIRKGVGAVDYDGEGLSGGVLSLVGGGDFNFIIANFGKIGLRVNLTLDLIVDIINAVKKRTRGGVTRHAKINGGNFGRSSILNKGNAGQVGEKILDFLICGAFGDDDFIWFELPKIGVLLKSG